MDPDDLFAKMNFMSLNNQQQSNVILNLHPEFSFKGNQDDEENQIIVINDGKTELSQIKETDNESQSVTESEFKSTKEIQFNLRENINLNEEKKENEFLRPHDINLNKKNESNINKNNDNKNSNNNMINSNIINNKLDFEDLVKKKYGLFPII